MSKSPYPVGPGWWRLLDGHIPELHEIDPGITGLEIKEKGGICDVSLFTNNPEAVFEVVSSIGSQSAGICENCGGHRTIPDKWRPWCERCKDASPDELSAIREETKELYFRGSHDRHGDLQDRGEVRRKRLKDFLDSE